MQDRTIEIEIKALLRKAAVLGMNPQSLAKHILNELVINPKRCGYFDIAYMCCEESLKHHPVPENARGINPEEILAFTVSHYANKTLRTKQSIETIAGGLVLLNLFGHSIKDKLLRQ